MHRIQITSCKAPVWEQWHYSYHMTFASKYSLRGKNLIWNDGLWKLYAACTNAWEEGCRNVRRMDWLKDRDWFSAAPERKHYMKRKWRERSCNRKNIETPLWMERINTETSYPQLLIFSLLGQFPITPFSFIKHAPRISRKGSNRNVLSPRSSTSTYAHFEISAPFQIR